MSNSDAGRNAAHSPDAPRDPAAAPSCATLSRKDAADLILTCLRLLMVNGQTTEQMAAAATHLAEALGFQAILFPHWGELTLRIEDDAGVHFEIIAVAPTGVDMNKVAATMNVIDDLRDGRINAEAARSDLEAITQYPPVSIVRFALLAAAGAAALGVIFGAADPLSLILIAFSAGAGAVLRRGVAKVTASPFAPPLCAALLAGVIGAIVAKFNLSPSLRLIAVCPCMVLVPGPHLLNGMLDLARTRIVLGAARIGYASLIILMICAGLLLGLSLGGVTVPVSESSSSAPFLCDVAAAGVAVAAYGAFFSMPWRMLPIPILVGMLAHACRWGMISALGASVEAGAFVACLVAGIITTQAADRLRLPFAAVAFASVVSLIPGVFIFQMAGGLAELMTLDGRAPFGLLPAVFKDGMTAFLITLAMGFGLIIPRMFIPRFCSASARFGRASSGRRRAG
ncbi:MAG: threonine/serine exporter family protein [Methylocella sp.]